jgi:hypothetical protein
MSLAGRACKTAIPALFLAAGLLAAAPDQGISSYPATFFAESQPRTAYDMIERLPHFTLDTGTSARGFAGTAGNVLVDGIRPTAKTDNLTSILTRIPADEVERIDIIRGGAPGKGYRVVTAPARGWNFPPFPKAVTAV